MTMPSTRPLADERPSGAAGAAWRPLERLARRAYGLRWTVLPPATAVAMFALIAGMMLAPRDAVEGDVQRLFYIHVPAAIASYIAFFVTFVCSIVLLWKRDMRWDAPARASATVGVLFISMTLALGAIWGKPIWGVYWTWDARLTSTLVLLLLYGGYVLARSLAEPTDEQAARYGAVFAILAFVDIPIISMSVRWWRTLHPQPIVFRATDRALPLEMEIVFYIGLAAIVLLGTWLIVLKAESEVLGERLRELRARLDRREE